MEEESKVKIEETVREILKESDMTEMTDFKVCNLASERLGIDLSDKSHKAFVRGIVKSFLEEMESKQQQEQDNQEEEEERGKGNKEFDDEGDLIICRLSDRRRVTVQEFKGKSLVSIREYYKKDGKELPSSKGEDDRILGSWRGGWVVDFDGGKVKMGDGGGGDVEDDVGGGGGGGGSGGGVVVVGVRGEDGWWISMVGR